MEDLLLARLVYLANEYKIRIPGTLKRWVPLDWLMELPKGLTLAAQKAEAPIQHFRDLYETGKSLGSGSNEEGRALYVELITSEMPDLPLQEKVELFALLHRFLNIGEEMVFENRYDLANPPETTGVPKFDSGFAPFDLVLGGFYQAILLIQAKPGVGKTSLMLTMAEELSKHPDVSSILFVQNEIPGPLMLGRMNPIFKRTEFSPGSELICGSWNAGTVLDHVREHPDEDRVVFFDSPDIVGNDNGSERRFVLEKQFQDLIKVKQRSKLVVTSSQVRRKDARPGLESPAEAWQKSWLSDIILGINKVGNAPNGGTRLQVNSAKNRFGPADNEVTFIYNYEDLSWSGQGLALTDDDDDW